MTSLRKLLPLMLVIVMAMTVTPATAESQGCQAGNGALAVSRTVEIDADNGPIFGQITTQKKEPSFLNDKEVVLTFDDGPMPWITKSILDTLDKYCTKATFFSVGRMALTYPDTVQEVLARGHTLGTHTMTHPFNMPRMAPSTAHSQIEQGFAAVATAAGQPIAPFFRFPGLADSAALMDYLQSRGIAAFTVDVVSNDSYIHSASTLTRRTLAQIDRLGGGIVLFHDIKATTAKALPHILAGLAKRGYKVVHITAAKPYEPLDEAVAAILPRLKKTKVAATDTDDDASDDAMPFYGRVHPSMATEQEFDAQEITKVSPAARARQYRKRRSTAASTRAASSSAKASVKRRYLRRKQKSARVKRRKGQRRSTFFNNWQPFATP